jgi:hypothetical protein
LTNDNINNIQKVVLLIIIFAVIVPYISWRNQDRFLEMLLRLRIMDIHPDRDRPF